MSDEWLRNRVAPRKPAFFVKHAYGNLPFRNHSFRMSRQICHPTQACQCNAKAYYEKQEGIFCKSHQQFETLASSTHTETP